eukprot:CAMPEP_0178381272 /NCGR_PEP_ID=MMETSP0689_2-20121128/5895_1 /TAXON_ID=160604 /ORGANISM="Amphidinium massartii, Strain CS-259" /LENGTH=1502 /DNA_ID=CAMNT_0020001445 /DNA_START=15 /DNA_END=4520 /DNA_ORIENTATION=+
MLRSQEVVALVLLAKLSLHLCLAARPLASPVVLQPEEQQQSLTPPINETSGQSGVPNCPDAVSKRVLDGNRYQFQLERSAAVLIRPEVSYKLSRTAACSGDNEVKAVTVLPWPVGEDMLSSSYGVVLVQPHEEQDEGTYFLCKDDEAEAAENGCLTSLEIRLPAWRLRHLLLKLQSATLSSVLQDIDNCEPRTRLAIDIMEGALCGLFLLLLLVTLHGCWAYYQATGRGSDGHESSGAVLVPTTHIDLKHMLFQALALVGSLATLQGMLLNVAITTLPSLIIWLIVVWPCTFGAVSVIRVFTTLCQRQLVHAVLRHGVCIAKPLSAVAYDIFIMLGFTVLACTMVAPFLYPAFRAWLFEANTFHLSIFGMAAVLLGFYFGPALQMGKAIAIAREADSEIATTMQATALSRLVRLVRPSSPPVQVPGNRERSASLAIEEFTGETEEDNVLDNSITDGSLTFVPLRKFLAACRAGEDPMQVKGEDDDGDEDQASGNAAMVLLDMRWHADFIYKLTGNRVAFANLPLLVLLLFSLVFMSSVRGVIFMSVPACLVTMNATTGALIPEFDRDITRYALLLDESRRNTAFVVTVNPVNTVNIDAKLASSSDLSHSSSNAVSVRKEIGVATIAVELSGLPFPRIIQLTVVGVLGRKKHYTIQLLPVRTVVESVVLRTPHLVRCIPWSEIPGSMFALPAPAPTVPLSNATDDVQVELALADITLMVPMAQPPPNSLRIHTIFKKKTKISSDLCQLDCDEDPECLDSWPSTGGCLMAYSSLDSHKTEQCIAANERPATSRGSWMQRHAEARLCMSTSRSVPCQKATSGANYRVVFQPSQPSWQVDRATLMFKVDVMSQQSRVGKDFDAKLQIFRRTPLPSAALVHVQGGGSEGTSVTARAQIAEATVSHQPFAQASGGELVITLGRYNASQQGESLQIDIAALMADRIFQTQWHDGQAASVIEDEGQWPQFIECTENPEQVQRYSPCGGGYPAQVATFNVSTWRPSEHPWVHFFVNAHDDFKMYFPSEIVRVRVQTEKDVEPAVWLVEDACSLPYFGLLSQSVACAAMTKCRTLWVGPWTAVDSKSPLSPEIVLDSTLRDTCAGDEVATAQTMLCAEDADGLIQADVITSHGNWSVCASNPFALCYMGKQLQDLNSIPAVLSLRAIIEEARGSGLLVHSVCMALLREPAWKVQAYWDVKLIEDLMAAAVAGGHVPTLTGLVDCLEEMGMLEEWPGNRTRIKAIRSATAAHRADLLKVLLWNHTSLTSAFLTAYILESVRHGCLECISSIQDYSAVTSLVSKTVIKDANMVAVLSELMPHLGHLQRLALFNVDKHVNIADLMFNMRWLKSLEALKFNRVSVCSDDVAAVYFSEALLAWTQLRSLTLRHPDCHGSLFGTLIASLGVHRHLRSLSVFGTPIETDDDELAPEFVQALSNLTHLEYLRLSMVGLSNRSSQQLASVLPKLQHLRTLDLRQNAVGKVGAALLWNATEHMPNLTTVKLRKPVALPAVTL